MLVVRSRFQMQPLDVFDLNLLDAADVRPFLRTRVRAEPRQELDLHLPTAAPVRAVGELDLVGRRDPLLLEFGVVREHQQVVLMVGPFALAADLDLPVKPPFDQASEPAAIQVQRAVESQAAAVLGGPAGHLHDNRMPVTLRRVGFVFVGNKDNRQRIEIDPAVASDSCSSSKAAGPGHCWRNDFA